MKNKFIKGKTMRNFRNYFVMLTVAIMALFGASCSSSDDEEELDVFIKYGDPSTFNSVYNSHPGPKALIDIRSAADFAKGSLPGAVNFPADVYNTQDNDSQWCKDIKAVYSTNTCLFIFGTTNFTLTTAVGGRASKIGFGKQNSRVSEKGYAELIKIWVGEK